jgi:hypothetical protein
LPKQASFLFPQNYARVFLTFYLKSGKIKCNSAPKEAIAMPKFKITYTYPNPDFEPDHHLQCGPNPERLENEITVEASDEEAARKEAMDDGVVIESVRASV